MIVYWFSNKVRSKNLTLHAAYTKRKTAFLDKCALSLELMSQTSSKNNTLCIYLIYWTQIQWLISNLAQTSEKVVILTFSGSSVPYTCCSSQSIILGRAWNVRLTIFLKLNTLRGVVFVVYTLIYVCATHLSGIMYMYAAVKASTEWIMCDRV